LKILIFALRYPLFCAKNCGFLHILTHKTALPPRLALLAFQVSTIVFD